MKFIFALLILNLIQTARAHEVLQSFLVDSKNQNLTQISQHFEIKQKKNKFYEVYVLKEKVDEFLKLAPHAKLLSEDINSELRNKNLDGYHKYHEVKSLYQKFVKDYPSIVSLEKYGESRKGNELFSLKISDNVTKSENEPKLLITSATHGDELITVEVQIRLVKELLEKAQTDTRIQNMISNYELYFIPVVNPDGFLRRNRYAGRTDPNRDYAWPERPNKQTKSLCIQNLISFFDKHQFVGSLDIHASGKMVMFPWAYTRESIQASDFNFMDQLTQKMASHNQYKHGPISKVIYVAKGSSADYYYWKYKTVAIAVELTTSKAPRSTRIAGVVDESREMLWTFIESF
jgi:murein tripeptide amidase MpaA